MRRRIINNLNRFSNPEPSSQSLNQTDQTNSVVRSQTDSNINEIKSQTKVLPKSLSDSNRKKKFS